MEVTFRLTNPTSGRQSFLMRFDSDEPESSPPFCVLVDPGEDVRPQEILDSGDRLAAVVLTHSHVDHYLSIDRCIDWRPRDGESTSMPVFSSPGTARTARSIAKSNRYSAISNTDRFADILTPITDWRSVGDTGACDVRLRPVPAGHCPGAAGFVFQFRADETEEWQSILATGDWTPWGAGRTPGLDSELSVQNLETVFLTASTRSHWQERTIAATAEIIQAATDGPVLTTCNSMVGVQMACILTAAAERLGSADSDDLGIRLVGRTAKLYGALGYQSDLVTTIPTFDDPSAVIEGGVVTIAGPRIPKLDDYEGSSGHLYNAMRHDPSATHVQLSEPGESLRTEGHCRSQNYEFVNHPTEEDLDALIHDLSPMNTVILHDPNHEEGKYDHRWYSFSWTPYDRAPYTIYADGWTGPQWTGPDTNRRVDDRTPSLAERNGMIAAIPDVDPGEPLDLEDIGVDPIFLEAAIGSLQERREEESSDRSSTSKYALDWTPDKDPTTEDVSDGPDRPDVGVGANIKTTKYTPSATSISGKTVSSNSSDSDGSEKGHERKDVQEPDEEDRVDLLDRGTMFDTVAPDHRLSDEEIQARAEAMGIDLDSLQEWIQSNQNQASAEQTDSDQAASRGDHEGSESPGTDSSSAKETPNGPSPESDSGSSTHSEPSSLEPSTSAEGEEPDPEDPTKSSDDEYENEETTEESAEPSKNSDQGDSDEVSDDPFEEDARSALSIDLEPDVHTIARREAAKRSTTVETLVDEAVDHFVRSAIGGSVPAKTFPSPNCESVEFDDRTEYFLEILAEESSADTKGDLLVELVRDAATDGDAEESSTARIVELHRKEAPLEGFTENEEYGFDSVDEVVQTAVLVFAQSEE